MENIQHGTGAQPASPQRAARKNASIVSAIVGASLALSACSSSGAEQEEVLNAYGLEGMDAREIIDYLDQQPIAERPTDLMASVRSEELILSNQAGEVTLAMPEDRSYVSVAPFVSQTHDCYYHSLTTCVGELDNEPVEVSVFDEETGTTLVDGPATTFDNGFAGFWVPRGSAGTITVNYQGLEGTTEFATGTEDATCITDLRLS